MKEQVTDISKMLQNMAEEMRLMRETINQQYAEIAKLNRNIESLNHQLRKKNERITELEDRLSKYEGPDKNSGNSSTPPSKERMKDEIVRRTKTLRKPSGKNLVVKQVIKDINFLVLTLQTKLLMIVPITALTAVSLWLMPSVYSIM